MSEVKLWEFLLQALQVHGEAGMLVVVDSLGSSPGRRGFKMALSPDGGMIGSVGGGIMEHKLVELVRSHFGTGYDLWALRRQVHSKKASQDQSGMICSGEQRLAMLVLRSHHIPEIQFILECQSSNMPCLLQLDAKSLSATAILESIPSKFELVAESNWKYEETLGRRDVAHVIGAGHVGLEMCKVLSLLGFHVVNYDDRPNLNTMTANDFANEKIVTPYADIGRFIKEDPSAYVIVMTFGYRGDDEAIRALLGRKFRYIGMMGSQAKVAQLLADLRKDGYDESSISQISTPAGLVSHCKTPMEIAVSIAAEIIGIRNRSE